jgi:hypothetical protein
MAQSYNENRDFGGWIVDKAENPVERFLGYF